MDVAASEFYNAETGMYELKKSGQGNKTTDEMIAWFDELVEKYPIISIEDGLGERDWDGWKKLTEHLGKKIQLVGDDLFVTNPEILQEGIDKDTANAILIKVNQIGHADRNLRRYGAGQKARLHGGCFPSFRRNRGHHHRGHRCGVQCRPDQDRVYVQDGPYRRVQPADPHRGRAGRRGPCSRANPQHLQALSQRIWLKKRLPQRGLFVTNN